MLIKAKALKAIHSKASMGTSGRPVNSCSTTSIGRVRYLAANTGCMAYRQEGIDLAILTGRCQHCGTRRCSFY